MQSTGSGDIPEHWPPEIDSSPVIVAAMARRSARKAAGLPQTRREAIRPVPAPDRRPLRVALVLAGVAVIAGGTVGGLLLARGGGAKPVAAASGHSIRWNRVPQLQTGPPPWTSQSDLLPRRLAPAGLQALTAEGTVLHVHEHLDLYVKGRKVTVPALVGIDEQAGFLTELHTHDASGIIHVESPAAQSFTLGQFFCEWGVRLSATCLGSYRGKVSWWVNGVRQHGNPAQLVLGAHQEIVVAAGAPPPSVPSSYSFPAGL